MMIDKPSNIGIPTPKGGGVDLIRSSPAPDKTGESTVDVDAVPKNQSAGAGDAARIQPKVVENEKVQQNKPSQQELVKERADELKERVNQAIPRVRELMQKNQRSLDFQLAEEDNRVIITVIDKETEKVIRQIPPEDFLNMAESISQGLETFSGGTLLNSRA